MEIPVWIIMHKGQVLKGKWFYTCEQARNWLKMNSPKRKFKEPERNTFVDTQFGSTFKVLELKYAYEEPESTLQCHTIYAGMSVFQCATVCAGLDNCPLKK